MSKANTRRNGTFLSVSLHFGYYTPPIPVLISRLSFLFSLTERFRKLSLSILLICLCSRQFLYFPNIQLNPEIDDKTILRDVAFEYAYVIYVRVFTFLIVYIIVFHSFQISFTLDSTNLGKVRLSHLICTFSFIICVFSFKLLICYVGLCAYLFCYDCT